MTTRQKILIGLLVVPTLVVSLGNTNKSIGENEGVAMTKAEFVEEVIKAYKDTGISMKSTDISMEDASKFIDAVFATMAEAIRKDGRFTYRNFGRFTVVKRGSRIGRNPRTEAEMRVRIKFYPAPSLKKSLSGFPN